MRIGLVALIMTVVVFPHGFSFAKSQSFEVGSYGMYVVPLKENFSRVPGGGGFVRYRFHQKFSAEIAAEFARWKFETTIGGTTGTITGNVKIIPITGTFRYHFWENDRWLTYLGIGPTGMLILNREASGTLTPGGAATIRFDHAVGGHATLGMALRMANHWYLSLDPKYTWIRSKTTETVAVGSFTFDNANLQNFTFPLGVIYQF